VKFDIKFVNYTAKLADISENKIKYTSKWTWTTVFLDKEISEGVYKVFFILSIYLFL
jgi:hypothetical protein